MTKRTLLEAVQVLADAGIKIPRKMAKSVGYIKPFEVTRRDIKRITERLGGMTAADRLVLRVGKDGTLSILSAASLASLQKNAAFARAARAKNGEATNGHR